MSWARLYQGTQCAAKQPFARAVAGVFTQFMSTREYMNLSLLFLSIENIIVRDIIAQESAWQGK